MIVGFGDFFHPVAEQPFGMLDAALQVTDGIDRPQVDPQGHHGQGDLRRNAGNDHLGAHQPGRVHRLHQMVGHPRVDGGDPGMSMTIDLGPVGPDRQQQVLGQLPGPLGIDLADDRQQQHPFAERQHRGGKFPDRLLLQGLDGPLAGVDIGVDGQRDIEKGKLHQREEGPIISSGWS